MPRLVNAVLASCALVGALAPLAACNDDSGPARPDAGPHVDAGPEPTSLGDVLVIETTDRSYDQQPFRAYGRIEGRIRTGADPVWHQEVMNDGTCRLLKFTPALCDEYCEGVCTAPNVCQPYPTYISVGTLTLTGLVSGMLPLQPIEGINWYYPSTPLPGDLFADDATVGMNASGSSDMPAFQAETHAVPRLEAEIASFQITLKDGEDHLVEWTPAGDPSARVRLTINSNNSGHGAPYNAIIECEAYDDASQIRIPAAMVEAFPENDDWDACAGSDCPRSWMRRFAQAYATVPGGGVRLIVGSEIQFGVVHHRAP